MPGRHDHELARFTDLSQVKVVLTDLNGTIISDVVPSVVVTEIDHYIIHKGCSFIFSDSFTIAAGATLSFIMLNPTTEDVHLKTFVVTSSQANAEVFLYNGSTSDDMGTPLTFYNQNFSSVKTTNTQLGHTPTNLVNPAHVQHFLITGTKQSGGLADSGVEEYVLAQNSKVVLGITNNSGQPDVVDVKIAVLDVGQL